MTQRVAVDAAFFALYDASDDGRFREQLKSICIERDVAVASNGYIVAAVEHTIKGDKSAPFAPFCVSAADVKRIGRALGKDKKAVEITAPDAEGNVTFTAADGGAKFTAKAQEVSFPDWRRCINTRHEPKPCGMISLDAEFLSTLSAIVRARGLERHSAFHPGQLTLRLNGDGAVWVTHPECDGFFAAIMPVGIDRSIETSDGREDALRAKWLEPEVSAEVAA